MWEGQRESSLTRWLVITEAGIRLSWRIMWLRRVVFLAFSPVLFFGFMFYIFEVAFKDANWVALMKGWSQFVPMMTEVTGDLNANSDVAEVRHRIWSVLFYNYFSKVQSFGMVTIVAVIAPKLISQDLRTRAILLYFSRPIAIWEYIVGKMAVVWFYLACVTAFPALMVYVVGIAMAPDMSVLLQTWDLPFRSLAGSLILIVPATSVAVFFSSMTQESRFAAFAWLTFWVVGIASYNMLLLYSQATVASQINAAPFGGDQGPGEDEFEQLQAAQKAAADRWATLSPFHAIGRIQSWVFFGTSDATRNDWIRLGLIVAVTLGSTWMTVRRVRRPLES